MRATISIMRPTLPAPSPDAIGVLRIYGNFDPLARSREERFTARSDRDVQYGAECVHAACALRP